MGVLEFPAPVVGSGFNGADRGVIAPGLAVRAAGGRSTSSAWKTTGMLD